MKRTRAIAGNDVCLQDLHIQDDAKATSPNLPVCATAGALAHTRDDRLELSKTLSKLTQPQDPARAVNIASILLIVEILARPLIAGPVGNAFGFTLPILSLTYIAAVRARSFPSWRLFFKGEPQPGIDEARIMLRRLPREVACDPVIFRTVVIWLSAVALQWMEYLVQSLGAASNPTNFLDKAWVIAAVLPASSIPALYLAKWMKPAPEVTGAGAGWLKFRNKLLKGVQGLLTDRYPYISAYAGFISFCLLAAFLPSGLGSLIAGWIGMSMFDANMYSIPTLAPPRLAFEIGLSDPSVTAVMTPQFYMSISTCVSIALITAGSGIAVRLSAGFQTFITRLIVHNDNLLESLMETANVRSVKISLTESHPHIRNVCSILKWLTFCYLSLFALVAFCPAPLGTAIANWLTTCLMDAGLISGTTANLNYVSTHLNVRLFLASVVAAFGTVPVAIMSCSFLPNKRPQLLIVSEQGLLCPTGAGSLIGQSPLKMWRTLKKASLVNSGKANETLKLNFGRGCTIKVKTASLENEKLSELLAAADEYATNCKFAAEVTQLRARLCQGKENISLAKINKFSSTVFTPHNSGDLLKEGTYRVVRKLAGKSLSAVYLARDLEDRHVVIKQFVLPSSAEQSDRLEELFNREYILLKTLNNKSIAQVLETFEQDGARYLVMEYIRGTDLRSIVQRRGPRSEKTVVKWANDIAQIMLFLHAQTPSILHRDLTPDNLMQDQDGEIKLIDFGAAHQFVEGVTGTLIGKQCYIAPEQLRGAPNAQSDIYSYGCTLYFLLSGKDPAALHQSDLEEVGIRSRLANIVRKCTAFDQSERFASFGEILQELKTLDSKPSPLKLREHLNDFCRI